MFYYNPRQKSVCSYAIPDFNYGVSHFYEGGRTPSLGMKVSNHDKFYGRFKAERERLIHDTLGRNLRDPSGYSKPNDDQLVCFNLIFKELKKRDFNSRVWILLDLLGFRDSGIHVDDDWLFIYDFFNQYRKFEVYLNFKDGAVTEINTFDYTGMTPEAKYPVCVEGFTSMLEEVLQDLLTVNMADGLKSDTVDTGTLEIRYVYDHWPYIPGHKPLEHKGEWLYVSGEKTSESPELSSGKTDVVFSEDGKTDKSDGLTGAAEKHDGKALTDVPEKRNRTGYSWVPENFRSRASQKYDSDFEYRPDRSPRRYNHNREDMETVREKAGVLDSILKKCGFACMLLAFPLFMFHMVTLGFVAIGVGMMISYISSSK